LESPAINAHNVSNDCEAAMASITIRNLDDPLKARLRIQAAIHGRSMEDEARDILRSALSREPSRQGNLATAIRARFAPLGGVELPTVPREPMRAPPSFDE
jgi:plasmid stability protein